jgi:hypothetical protein
VKFWLGLLLWPLLSAAAVLAVCLFVPPTYTAATLIAIQPSARGWDGPGANLPAALPSLAQYGALLQSRRVADRIVAAFDLQAAYREPTLEDTRERLAGAVQFGSTKGGQLIIQASDRYPWRAADLAHQFAVELQQLLDELRVQAAHARADRLHAEVARVEQRVAQAHVALQASRLDARQLKLEPRLAGAQFFSLQLAVRSAELRLASLRTHLQDGSADVQRQLALADAVRAQLRRIGAGDDARPMGALYADAARDVRLLEPWLQQLRMQATQAEMDAGVRTEALISIDPATIPERPSGPFALGYMALAWLATLAGLLARAWQRRRRHTRIR